MTRIVAGTAGGRTLAVPRSGTRPTSERVREALFSRLEHLGAITDARVLDLYAGTGALGLEAVSRGARSAVLVESARAAAELCRRNARELGLSARVVAGRAQAYLADGPPLGEPFELVLLDPPYDIAEAELAGVLAQLVNDGFLAEEAVVVVERSRRNPEPAWPAGLAPVDSRRYGDTVVWFAEPDPQA